MALPQPPDTEISASATHSAPVRREKRGTSTGQALERPAERACPEDKSRTVQLRRPTQRSDSVLADARRQRRPTAAAVHPGKGGLAAEEAASAQEGVAGPAARLRKSCCPPCRPGKAWESRHLHKAGQEGNAGRSDVVPRAPKGSTEEAGGTPAWPPDARGTALFGADPARPGDDGPPRLRPARSTGLDGNAFEATKGVAQVIILKRHTHQSAARRRKVARRRPHAGQQRQLSDRGHKAPCKRCAGSKASWLTVLRGSCFAQVGRRRPSTSGTSRSTARST